MAAERPGAAADPRFAAARARSLSRRRRARLRLVLGLGGALALGGGAALWFLAPLVELRGDLRSDLRAELRAELRGVWDGVTGSRTAEMPGEGSGAASGDALAAEAVAEDGEAAGDEAGAGEAAGVTPDEEEILAAFINLPGDPMRLVVAAEATRPAERLPRPEGLPAERGAGAVLAIRDALVPAGERVVSALPSSREDFAVFQAQRRGLVERARPVAVPEGGVGEGGFDPDAPVRTASGAAALVRQAEAAGATGLGFGRLALARPEARRRSHEDAVLRVTAATPLAELLAAEGLAPAEAAAVAAAAAAHLGAGEVAAGQVVVLRRSSVAAGAGTGSGAGFAQLAIYSETERLGVLARAEAGEAVEGEAVVAALPAVAVPPVEAGSVDEADRAEDAGPVAPVVRVVAAEADPWAGTDHFALAGGAGAASGNAAQRVRLLDALYSAAMRHRLPPVLVGELIMMLAEAHDLDAEAGPRDRLTLLVSSEPAAEEEGGSGLGQVLFVAIEGEESRVRCYIHRSGPGRPYTCYGSGPRRAGSAAAAAAAAPLGGLTEGAAVEQLIDRIIQIESAGRADARNPLSTATGLGQFIESTWLRMMRTYRPDLVATHSREELLAMRVEPDISREMVENLAREGEAFLRARGHQITAGRLYLAHFLGMEGAHVVLSAPTDGDLEALLGTPVIRANPFLRGWDVAQITDWAESRMRTRGGRTAVVREPAGLAEFRAAVDVLLAEG